MRYILTQAEQWPFRMARQRQVGVFGGTFDPPHNGHLATAKAVADQMGLDQVIFVPTGQSYQKQGTSPAEHRLAMTQLATKADPRFSVSRVDVDRPGPTYTADTLRDLQDQNPDAQLHFIAGSDALANMPTWHGYPEQFQRSKIVTVDRPGYPIRRAMPPELPANAVQQVRAPRLWESSTEVRDRVGKGQSIDDMVPSEVSDYISKNGLYRQRQPAVA